MIQVKTMKCLYVVLLFVPTFRSEINSVLRENDLSDPCTDKNHFFLAPGVLTAGSLNRACISRFYAEGPANLLLTLRTEDKQIVTASRELPPGDGGCLDIMVPMLPNTRADLTVNIRYPASSCSWQRSVTLRVASGRVAMLHTERARYRPGDTLRARVFAMKADLTPAHGSIEEIWLEGPPGAWEGTRVAEWTNIRSKMGLAQIQHELDELAPPGRWTVRAKLSDGSQGSAAFWVGNYELPPFQLTVRHAPRILRTSERLVWTVCVRYPWSEGVAGMLVVRLRGSGSGSGGGGGVRTALRLRGPRACHRHAVAATRLALNSEHAPHVVIADFSFQEEGTRIWQNTTVVSQVVDKPITLQFLTKPRTVLSPGLPYKLKVKATRWDDKPAMNERVTVCRSASEHVCVSGDTDAAGVARVMFQADDAAPALYTFQATLSNDTTIATVPLTLVTRRSHIQAALGPLRADPHGARTFVPLYLSLHNSTVPVTVHFVVITRGGIIYRWGATTQCPIASSFPHVQIAHRDSKCDSLPQYDDNRTIKNKNQTDTIIKNNYIFDKNRYYEKIRIQHEKINFTDKINQNDAKNSQTSTNSGNKEAKNGQSEDKNGKIEANNNQSEAKSGQNDVNSVQYDANDSDSLLDRHLLRIMLPIKVTQQMCPDSHLIAYFYYNGEFVSANKHFEMDDCFVNKVEATFSTRQTLPGSPVSLQLLTPGPALCALTAIDTAAKVSPLSVKDLMISGLKKMIDAHRNVTEYDAAGDCFLNVDTPEPPKDSVELTASWLAGAGVRTVGDVALRRHCDVPAPLIDEGTVPRTDFSEAWLWRLGTVGMNGSAIITGTAPHSITRFEAGAVCLSRTGVAVSQPAVIQVFREFFIHADSPKRLRRGDSAIIRYRLFNYLYEPLSVQIQLLTDSIIEGPPISVESVCVPARGSAARRAGVRARGVGGARVFIRAKAVGDGACGNGTATRGVSDEVEIKIKVDPEGFPVHEQKSTLLCGSDNSLSSSSKVNWSWSPVSAVPGTESLTLWAIGDIKGPLLASSDSLVVFPRGCGEQNMARLATNLVALDHLEPSCPAAATAMQHVARGFTRQLQYIHPSGGFSAFGSSDVTASTWLTAFSLRYMRRAHQVLWPGKPVPPALKNAERWLLNQQMENGCFRNEGQVFHRELRGGLNEEGEIASVALTAYVITSLIESTSPLPSRIIHNTLSCLRALPPLKYKTPTRIYAHALLSYAFMRLKSYEENLKKNNEELKEGLKRNEGLIEVMELIKMARREGDYMWWETSSLSSSIEATSYALLSLRESPSVLREYGAAAIRWLAAHRNVNGGFLTTQDTLVGLEALSSWSSLAPSPANLTVTAVSGTVTKTVNLRPDDNIPAVMKMMGDEVSVSVQGSGCAVIQATRTYNTLSTNQAVNKRLSVQLSVHTDGTFDCDTDGNNCYCAAVVESCVSWSEGFPEMALLEISLPGGFGADSSKLYEHLHQHHNYIRRIELSTSGSKATLYLGARFSPPHRGHACFNVHTVGPRTKTKPAYVKLYDYYNPLVNDTQVYTIPEECPARITHDSSQDITNNLFNKARALDDEIIITHEFTFEDIPEGIPLEDPLYDLRDGGNLRDLDENTTSSKNSDKNNDIGKLNGGPKPDFSSLNSEKESSRVLNGDQIEFDHIIVEKSGQNKDMKPESRSLNIDIEKNLNYNETKDIKQNDFSNVNTKQANKIEKPVNKSHESINISTNSETSTVNQKKLTIETHQNHQNVKVTVENPNLSDFHVIDTEKDLDVPSGVEGPIPSVVLPPENFVPPPQDSISTPNDYSKTSFPSNFILPPNNFALPPQTYVSTPKNFITSRNNFILPYSYVSPQHYSATPKSYVSPPPFKSPAQNLMPPPPFVPPRSFSSPDNWYYSQGTYYRTPYFRQDRSRG